MNKKIKKEQESLGGELSNIPNEKWGKFFAKFTEIDTLEVGQWKVVHLLGYFVRKYKETYGVDYPWKFNNQNPNKSFEAWQINTLAAKLSANPQILKDYIDWAYQELVPKAKRRLTSISFMTKDEIINPYKMNILLGSKKNLNVDRSTRLPESYIRILESNDCRVEYYGDLAFLSQMDPIPQKILNAFKELQAIGFDPEILKRII
jgi:hypothetical protein